MSVFSGRESWLPGLTSSRRDRVSNSSHELPRWRPPSPMAASMIPPPIIQSTYALPLRSPPSESAAPEPSIQADDREEQLHADLQYLLDAQADGLLRGLEASAIKDGTSTGSTTPTANTTRSSSARPSNRPFRRVPGLRSARKGLYSTMLALSHVKADELQAVDETVKANERDMSQIETWDKKREGLQAATADASSDGETVRVQRLQQEADNLQEGINEAELRLADMKSRHRKLVRQLASAENSVQAKLASYTQSMKLLEADVERFLSARPPSAVSRPSSSNGQASMWKLPAKRRTLEMAREQLQAEREVSERERQRVEREKAALDEGAKVWKEVAATVTALEKRVQGEMFASPLANPDQAWDDTPTSSPITRMETLLVSIDAAIETLQSKLQDSKAKDWKLLIVAIGAELEALRQGKVILQQALGQVADQPEPVESTADSTNVPRTDSGDEMIRELDRSFETAKPHAASNGDTDDEVDPELLFSQRDHDTD